MKNKLAPKFVAALLLAATHLCIWLPNTANAAVVTTTVLGTVTSGAGVTNGTLGAFGYPAGTDLSNKPFTLIYTVDDTKGTGTISTPPDHSAISMTITSNPITAVLTIGGGTESYNHWNISLGDGVFQSASTPATQYTTGENYATGPFNGSGAADVNVYFVNPVFANSWLWTDPFSYSPGTPDGATSGSFGLNFGWTDGIHSWSRGAGGSLTITSITVSGPAAPPSPPGTGVNPNNNGCSTCSGNRLSPPPSITMTPPPSQTPMSPPLTSLAMANPSAADADPVNGGTGNQFTREFDFAAAPHTHISFTRYYNSYDQSQVGLGVGWHSTYHHGHSATSTAATVTRPDGRQHVFVKSGSSWVPNSDVTSVLAAVTTTGGAQIGWSLTLPDDSIESYSLGGQLTSIKTREGLTTSLGYTSSLLTTVTGPYGHALSFTYTGNLLSNMTVPDGGVFDYAYDNNNNPIYVVHPDSSVRIYQFANPTFPNLMTGIIDENGNNYASWAYDSLGRVTTSQLAGGVQMTSLAYTSTATSKVTDALGNTHTYALTTFNGFVKPTAQGGVPYPRAGGASFGYDGNGFVSSVTDYDGNVTHYAYNAKGEETSHTDAFGTGLARTTTTTWHATYHLPLVVTELGRTTTYSYNASGTLASVKVGDGTHTRSWSYIYNANAQPISITDPLGHTTSLSYTSTGGNLATITNALGQVTTFNSYDADGRLLSMTDANGLTTTTTYNYRNEILQRTVSGEATTYTYGVTGQLTQVLMPDNSAINYSYDAAHRLAQVSNTAGDAVKYTYDLMSNVTGINVYDPSSTLKRTTTYTYDSANRLKTVNGAVLGETTTYGYDNNGNVLTITDPLSHVNTYTYDALNRRVTAQDALSKTTTFTYNTLDQLTMVKDPLGLTTTYSYDGLNDQLGVSSPDSGVAVYSYDSGGNLLTAKDALSQTTTYTYDALNRALTQTYTGGGSVTWLYDTGTYSIGHLSKMTDLAGTTSYTWDQHGRIKTKKQVTGTVTLTATYGYDIYGRLASLIYPSTTELDFAYDSSGRVNATGTAVGIVSAVTYFPFGPAKNWNNGSGTTMARTFDLDGRMTGITLGSTTTPTINSQTLTYDNGSRITQLVETGLSNKTYTYDNDDRLTKFFNGTATTSWAYDVNGNRLSSTLSGTTTYHYTASTNKLSSLTGTTTQSFTINANGSQTADGIHTWSYDGRGLAVSVTAAAATTTYGVNGFGQRLTKTATGLSGGGKNEYLYDEQGHLIGEYDSTGTAIEETMVMPNTPMPVLFGGTGMQNLGTSAAPVAVLTSGGYYWIAADWQDTPHIIQNISKVTAWTWDRYAFGDNTPNQNPAGLGTFVYNPRFPGQYADSESGTAWNGARIYGPSTGRYLQSDPLGLAATIPGSYSRYPYVGSNPLTRIDPRGLIGEQFEPEAEQLLDQLEAELPVVWQQFQGAAARFGPWAEEELAEIESSLGYAAESEPTISQSEGMICESFNYTNTVLSHAANRPFTNSPLTIQQIMQSGPAALDPQGANGWLWWQVNGTFNGSNGVYELLYNPTTNTVGHIVFKSTP